MYLRYPVRGLDDADFVLLTCPLSATVSNRVLIARGEKWQ